MATREKGERIVKALVAGILQDIESLKHSRKGGKERQLLK